ncbi:inorganic pyrophosphatase [Candidatus Woesearchaeota archaeon]|jgi:inorganic pyrophosphatase|nr:inorganic pyrophosphatase [Candidatus Woesearchaeota archaeon]MBT4111057.1 inorganic pyrophosphatase [Candidatus Woesearchaeota archaeon]MBT4336926.1 inorganic pyrophosphatase [Candidatus Woesearchaeota archaeon]MBT4469759.1 inorganic pyrophosphatase [Candidatus Woesearchaeota archaeon]MBT6743770.1 inorganic pyrophosphatase [Candidatus Woesearchaeota archaeon]
MSENISYREIKKLIGTIVEVTMDRPLGSKHPKCGFIYPVNYGFIEGITAPDGDDLDAYVLGIFEPVEKFTGKCIAIIFRDDDDDAKLIVVPKDKDYSDEQILALTEFQEQWFKPKVVRK